MKLNLGIGQKIYFIMIVMVGMFAVMAASNFQVISGVSSSTQKLVVSTLPEIIKGGALSDSSKALVNDASVIMHAASQDSIKTAKIQADANIETIGELVSTMSISDEEKQQMMAALGSASELINNLSNISSNRIGQQAVLSEKIVAASKLHEQIVREAAPVLDDADFNLLIAISEVSDMGDVVLIDDIPELVVGASEEGDTDFADLPKVDMQSKSAMLEENVSALSTALKFLAEVNLLIGYYRSAEYLPSREDIVPLEEQYTAAETKINRFVGDLSNDNIFDITEELLYYGLGYDSVFKIREAILIDQAKAHALANELSAHLLDMQGLVVARVQDIEAQGKAEGEGTVSAAQAMQGMILVVTIGIVLVSIGIALFYVRPFIVNRLLSVYHATHKVASGDLDAEIPKSGSDELAKIADSLLMFRDNLLHNKKLEGEQKEAQERAEREKREAMSSLATEFDQSIGGLIQLLTETADKLQSTAHEMNGAASTANGASQSVASSSDEASANVNAVVAAIEEMAASNAEITSQINNTRQRSNETHSHAMQASETVENLDGLVANIGEVVEAIRDIAEQTNLLALNATIEAARAGDAGKGFAVVADEVKKLATETGQKTDEIEKRMTQIQDATGISVSSTKQIIQNISEINEAVTAISAAVDEQNAANQEISRNASQTSQSVSVVNSTIRDIQDSTEKTGHAAGNVLNAADELSGLSSNLKDSVETLLKRIA